MNQAQHATSLRQPAQTWEAAAAAERVGRCLGGSDRRRRSQGDRHHQRRRGLVPWRTGRRRAGRGTRRGGHRADRRGDRRARVRGHRGRLFRCRGYGDSRAPGRGGRRQHRRSPGRIWALRADRASRPAGRRPRGRSQHPFVDQRSHRRVPAGTRRIDDALERSAVYAAAGADSLFVPGLVDPAAIAELAAGPLPVAVMVWPGAPSVAELAAAGAVRISLGSAIAQAAYAVAVRAATELLTSGTYDSVADGITYNTMNDAVTAAPSSLASVARRSTWPSATRTRTPRTSPSCTSRTSRPSGSPRFTTCSRPSPSS